MFFLGNGLFLGGAFSTFDRAGPVFLGALFVFVFAGGAVVEPFFGLDTLAVALGFPVGVTVVLLFGLSVLGLLGLLRF